MYYEMFPEIIKKNCAQTMTRQNVCNLSIGKGDKKRREERRGDGEGR